MNTIPELVTSYLEDNGLSLRGMADQISEQLGIEDAVSHQAVAYWADGTYRPNPTMMQLLYRNAHGELRDLAFAILKVQNKLPT
jgi:hypothetical protein